MPKRAPGRLINLLPSRVRRSLRRAVYAARVVGSLQGHHARTCPLCHYRGPFQAAGLPPAADELCPACGALARHRLFHLIDSAHLILRGVRSLLHFAPEATLREVFSRNIPDYQTADIEGGDVDHRIDMMATGLQDGSFDAVFASHVLEHVEDDRQALAEVARILNADGILVVMVPLVEAWPQTYENPGLRTASERELHFGQHDHVRLYGRDLLDRLGEKFEVSSYMATPAECVQYALVPGERVFVCRKRSDASG